jgi:hypothetical protein
MTTFPLTASIDFTLAAELATALALGLGFGFALERAGFGSARKLTAVFYLRDMAVVKVMFAAVVTTLAGLWLFATVGLLDLTELYLEPTNVLAQAVGGLLFGAGFLVGGYCPGTSIAAMATGRKDGLVFALGMLTGVWAYAEFTPGLDTWYRESAAGEITLPTLTGIGMGWWVLLFIAALAAGARGLSWVERRYGDARLQP